MTVINLPEGWATTSVGEVATYQNGRPFKPSEWGSTGLPIIRIQNLNDTAANYNFSDNHHEEKFRVRNGDLLFAWSASLGAYIWRGQEAWLNQHIFRVDHTEMVDRLFLYYALTDLIADLYAKTHGSGMVHVTKGKFEETQLMLPPLNEQRRIVTKVDELFSELDKGVESLKTARAKLNVYRQAVLKYAFEGKLTAQWREENKDKLEKPDQLLARIKQEREARYERQLREWRAAVKAWETKGKKGQKPRRPKASAALCLPSEGEIADLPLLPDGWLWIKVQALLAEPPANGHSVRDRASGFPVLRLTAIKKEKLDLSETKNGDWEREDALSYLVQEGDFLLARGNGSKQLVGRGGLVPASEHDLAYPDTMIRLRVDPSAVAGSFFSYVWNSRLLRRQIEDAARTTAGIYKINQGHILNFIVPLCSSMEQAVVVERLSAALSAIDGIETEVNKHLGEADTLRQSILKKAFSGQLVAQDPNDEPASVLLDRIRAEKEKAVKNNHSKKTKKRKTTA